MTETTAAACRTWGNYVLEARTEYGHAARGNRGRYAGTKVHRLHCEYIVALVDEAAEAALTHDTVGKRFLKGARRLNNIGRAEHTPRVPVLFSCRPACGCTSGQMAGKPVPHRTEADISCEKCKR